MFWRIEVANKEGLFDAVGDAARKDIEDLNVKSVNEIRVKEIYHLYGNLKEADIKKVSENILADSVSQDYRYFKDEDLKKSLLKEIRPDEDWHVVEIAHNPGVMDPWEESIRKSVADIGIKGLEDVKTAKQYLIKGRLDNKELDYICDKTLYNKLIQHVKKGAAIYTKEAHLEPHPPAYKFKLAEIDILKADDGKLLDISKKGQLYLNLDEMKMIQKYFRSLDRNPTDCELETVAQTWSEHCSHKSLKGLIEYEGKTIDNLLGSTIMQATRMLNKDWCVSVFEDNSGIIEFDENYNVCFKVETHNHPSALEPYGGASTGIGGVIRDPLGTGLGAKPIANTDIFCFGPPDYPHDKLPKGTLHPKRVIKGVVSGVRDYGNRMGIPTVNGAVYFNEGYIGNPLVYCGNIGIMPKDASFKKVDVGDAIIVVGGRTGRDGIHGATFSSGELTHESETISSSAVQIGNAICEKKMVDVILKARDKSLYKAITDCGAGGLSSAVGETGADCGARVELDKVPVKYKGLSYTEIWISESQERMVLGADKSKVAELLELFKGEDVEATVIGEYTDTDKLELFYEGNKVCELDMEFLHQGMPKIAKKAEWIKPDAKEPDIKKKDDYTDSLLKLLSTYDICSKEWIIRQYDHEVQAKTVLKPLGGRYNEGPNDAACIKPVFESKAGLLISCGLNPYYGELEPYWMAIASVDEALRQIVASGGNLERVAILDNFCWGSPDDAHQMGSLVRAAIGCHDAAIGYGVPFISGKDSLNNEYSVHGKRQAIPPTLLISAMGVIDDTSRLISTDFKEAQNPIYIVGLTRDELGASGFYRLHHKQGANIPTTDIKSSKRVLEALSKTSAAKYIAACHDISEGGLAVALAEMAIGGDLGAEIELSKVPVEMSEPRDDKVLFSESLTRFIVEVKREKKDDFEKALKDIAHNQIGRVSSSGRLNVKGLNSKIIVSAGVDELKDSWQKPLKW